MLLFPEPTKNQRPRSTARFLVESEGGVKRKNATILSTSHSHSDGVDLSSRQAQSPCVGTSQTPGFPQDAWHPSSAHLVALRAQRRAVSWHPNSRLPFPPQNWPAPSAPPATRWWWMSGAKPPFPHRSI